MFIKSFLHLNTGFWLFWGSSKVIFIQISQNFNQISLKNLPYLTDFSPRLMACMWQPIVLHKSIQDESHGLVRLTPCACPGISAYDGIYYVLGALTGYRWETLVDSFLGCGSQLSCRPVWHLHLSFFLFFPYILLHPLSRIMSKCTLYTPVLQDKSLQVIM